MNAGFSNGEMSYLRQHSTLSEIIERNTDTDYMQPDAFMTYNRHSGLLGGVVGGEGEEGVAERQLVIGSPGNDFLLAGTLDDILVPVVGGLQTMIGGEGADQFVFTHRGISAEITDFAPEDSVVFDFAGAKGQIRHAQGDTILSSHGSHIVFDDVYLHFSDILV